MATMAGAVLERWKVGLGFRGGGGKLCSGGMSTVEVLSEKEVVAEEEGDDGMF